MRNIVCDMCLNKGRGPKNVIEFALNHCQQDGTVRTNVILRRVRATIVAVHKQ